MKAGAAFALAALVLVAGACGGEPGTRSDGLDTVEVTSKPDAAASLVDEQVARPIGLPAAGLSGSWPEDFPREVPLPSPSSLVDFASGERERRVVLVVDLPAERVSEIYRRQLAAAGFEEREGDRFFGHGLVVRFGAESFHDAARLTIRVARL